MIIKKWYLIILLCLSILIILSIISTQSIGDCGYIQPFFDRFNINYSYNLTNDNLNGSCVSIDPTSEQINFSQNDDGNAYIKIWINDTNLKEVSADFKLTHRFYNRSRSESPRLGLLFGSNSESLSFTDDLGRIQYIGTDCWNYGGVYYNLDSWYTIKMFFEYDKIHMQVLNGSEVVYDNINCSLTRDSGFDDWHGNGSIVIGVAGSGTLENSGTLRTFFLDNLTITNQTRYEKIRATSDSREVYLRNEVNKTLDINLSNLQNYSKMINISMNINGLFETNYSNQLLTGWNSSIFVFNVEPINLSCGDYNITINIESNDSEDERLYLPLQIRKVPNPQRLEYLSWSLLDDEYVESAVEHGFTVHSTWSDTYVGVPSESKLTTWLALGMQGGAFLGSSRGFYTANNDEPNESYTLLSNGSYNSYTDPFYLDYLLNVSQGVVDAISPVKDHPGYNYILLDTEKKEGSFPYNNDSRDLLRDAGLLGPSEEIPSGFLNGEYVIINLSDPNVGQVVNGIIETNNTHYELYKWWRDNGAFNPVHCNSTNALKAVDSNIETTVEFGQQCADYLEHWYRTAADGENDPSFYDSIAESMLYSSRKFGHKNSMTFQFVASSKPLSPDLFSESAWIIISKRPDRMGHWGATECFTDNPGYPDECDAEMVRMKEMKNEVYDKFYPMIYNLNHTNKKAAFLISEANALYNDPNYYLLSWILRTRMKLRARGLTYANVQWDEIHDDDVINGNLSNYEVLFIMRTDILSENVYQQIVNFSNDGGKIIADDYFNDTFNTTGLNLYLIEDVNNDWGYIETNSKWWWTANDYEVYSNRYPIVANEIREKLNLSGVEMFATTDANHTVINLLEKSNVTYVFLINDLRSNISREAYGINRTVNLTLNLSEDKIIYDIINSTKIDYTRTDSGHIKFESYLSGGSAKIYAVYPREINNLTIINSNVSYTGEEFNFIININDSNGTCPGSQPINVSINGPSNQLFDISSYYGTNDGVYNLSTTIPLNMEKGVWNISVKELSTGLENSERFYVQSRTESIPLSPSNLSYNNLTQTSVVLNWLDNSDNELYYKIYRSSDNVSYTEIASVYSNIITYDNTGLISSTNYYYKILAYNLEGDSNYSNSIRITTLSASSSPPPGGSGGGGGGVIKILNKTCNESWVCEVWSDCVDNIKFRTCIDLNYCNSTKDKPEIENKCDFIGSDIVIDESMNNEDLRNKDIEHPNDIKKSKIIGIAIIFILSLLSTIFITYLVLKYLFKKI